MSAVDDDFRFERLAARAAWAFVAFGIVIRLVRFALAFPMWGDEAMLAANLHDRDYAGLAQGLDHWQVAPIGYLWAQKAVIDLFGFNDYSLRVVALISGVAALVLFRIAAGCVLRGWPLVFAVGALAVAHYPMRHSVEVKPYAGDLLAAVLLLEPYLAWLARPERRRSLWRLAITALVAVPLSFTAAFVGGGVSLALAWEAYRRRDRAVAAPWIAYNVALVGIFGLLYVTVMRNDYSVNGDVMRSCWEEGFPPSLSRWTAWPLWLLNAHGGEALAYPVGGDNGGSVVQLVLAIVGGAALWRTRFRGVAVVALTTLLVAFTAAVLQRYPYGYGERLQQFWGPAACLLIGNGAAVSGHLLKNAVTVRRGRIAFAGLLVLIGVGASTFDLLHPYKFRYDADHRNFSRWFWRFASPDEPMLELVDDLNTVVYDRYQTLMPRVYRQLYDPHAAKLHAATFAERLTNLPLGKPIRCVAFQREGESLRPEAFAAWQAAMSHDYRPAGEETFHVRFMNTGELLTYRIWRFEPKSPDAHPRTALQSPTSLVR